MDVHELKNRCYPRLRIFKIFAATARDDVQASLRSVVPSVV